MSRVNMIVQSRGNGLVKKFDDEAIAEWHQKCSDFRDHVGENKMTGGAFVVGETMDEDGFLPLMCLRGDSLTLSVAIRALIIAWIGQAKAEDNPLTKDEVVEMVASAMGDGGME